MKGNFIIYLEIYLVFFVKNHIINFILLENYNFKIFIINKKNLMINLIFSGELQIQY